MAKFPVDGPFNEGDRDHNLRPHPVLPDARQSGGDRERRLIDFLRAQSLAKVEQQLAVETGADFSGEDEVVTPVVADQQRTETDPCALGIGKASDDKIAGDFAFHLQPLFRAPMLVD